MKLAPRVIVSDAKARAYLLDPNHPDNGGKAALFTSFGFSLEQWQRLADALRQHPIDNRIFDIKDSSHGTKYVVRCNLPSPDGRKPCLTSVWMIDRGQTTPRLLTAYGTR